jgi:ribosomal protein S12 methylthiotransferase
MKLHYVSLGCPKNSIDLETILGGLAGRIEIVDDPEKADVALVNTCAFITSAKEEAIETILQLAAYKNGNPGLRLLVSGCLAQRYREELAQLLPEVDSFFFDRDARATAGEISRFLGTAGGGECAYAPRYRLTPKHYAYLRIADGCDNRCSYCAIPLIKGGCQSRPLAEIQEEAQILAADGVREVMIVAQDSTRYGHDLGTSERLHDVLAILQDVQGVRWIRLLYTHPAHWYDGLIDAMTGLDKVVPYIDLPIQHISDPILKAMGRLASRRQIEELINKLRMRIPNLALRTSLIVGFPGESEQDFSALWEFVRQTRFERLGVFAYSQEEGTAAGVWPESVSEVEKRARLQEIMEIQAEISRSRNEALVGRQLQVLVDQPGEESGTVLARTLWDAPEIDNAVIIDQELAPGTFATIECTAADVYDLYGRLVAVETS